RRYEHPGRAQRLLPTGGHARDVRTAVGATNPEPERAGIFAVEHPHRLSGRAGCPVRFPRPHPPRRRHGGTEGGRAVNLFVADPEWGWWIILYFFLGGLAAGAYFVSALIELVGGE